MAILRRERKGDGTRVVLYRANRESGRFDLTASSLYGKVVPLRPQSFDSLRSSVTGCSMGRASLCSLAGAGIGFLVGFFMVLIVAGASPARDTTAIAMFAGIFLTGAGAIAGAIVGGMAEFLTRTDQTKAVQLQRESESEA